MADHLLSLNNALSLENMELRARIARLESNLDAVNKHSGELLKANDALTAENAALREDKERLDYLEEHGCSDFASDACDLMEGRGKWFCWADNIPAADSYFIDLRSAIVAARGVKL